jgi:hypothetical protein
VSEGRRQEGRLPRFSRLDGLVFTVNAQARC